MRRSFRRRRQLPRPFACHTLKRHRNMGCGMLAGREDRLAALAKRVFFLDCWIIAIEENNCPSVGGRGNTTGWRQKQRPPGVTWRGGKIRR